MSKFRDHKYEWTHSGMSVQHAWMLRGPRGGLHLHVSLMDDTAKFPEPSCGLEFHHAFDPTGGREAAHHKQCFLIGGPCWHDGTSLYASTTVWPRVRDMMPDHKAIFKYLERLYEEQFEREET